MKTAIIEMLIESGGYLSGEEISRRIGFSRNSVWKAITGLKESGYVFDAVENKGYKLISIPDLVTPEILRAGLCTEFVGRKILYKEQIESTNNWAKQAGSAGENEGTVFIAEEQIGGRGRKGNRWFSEKNAGIWMSVLLRPDIHPMKLTQITSVTGLVICKTINEITGLNTLIKWPNDVLHNNRKICGVLTEMTMEPDVIDYIVVGIGINVNNKLFPDEIAEIATSLYNETGKEVNRRELIQAILINFEKAYKDMLAGASVLSMNNEIKRHSATLGHTVKTVYNNKSLTGRCIDLLPNGELVLECDNGEIINLRGGEITVNFRKDS